MHAGEIDAVSYLAAAAGDMHIGARLQRITPLLLLLLLQARVLQLHYANQLWAGSST